MNTTSPVRRPGNPVGRWIADRKVGSRIIALIATAAVVIGVFGVVAVRDLQDAGDGAETLVVANAATGSALEADMMHDAVRGDVLRALVSGRGRGYDSGRRPTSPSTTTSSCSLLAEVATRSWAPRSQQAR